MRAHDAGSFLPSSADNTEEQVQEVKLQNTQDDDEFISKARLPCLSDA